MPTTTQTTGAPEWMKPYFENYYNASQQVASRPYQQYQNPRVAPLSQMQNNALGGIEGSMFGNEATWGGQQYLGGIVNGVDSSAMRDRITRGVTDQYNNATAGITARFNAPGSFGGSRHALAQNQANQGLATGLGDALGQLELSDRNQRMAAANQAMGMNTAQINNLMTGLGAGQVPRQYLQDLYNVDYQDFQNQWRYPQEQLGILGSGLNMMAGGAGTTQTSQTPDPSRSSQNAGLLLGSLPFLFGQGGIFG